MPTDHDSPKRALANLTPDVNGEMRIVLKQACPQVEPSLLVKMKYVPNTDANT
ncbi:hypothetical protein [Solibacillus sp. FSL H8-0538]|uniref:hypothetical protein n=1 Tax=Solibacillus sp. FSL H8-0538 TaxID=2921400 RepID=UPI0030F87B11